jgi:hypothetical protein
MACSISFIHFKNWRRKHPHNARAQQNREKRQAIKHFKMSLIRNKDVECPSTNASFRSEVFRATPCELSTSEKSQQRSSLRGKPRGQP